MKLSEVAIWTCQRLEVPQFVEQIEVVVNPQLQTTLATASMKTVNGKKEYLLSINQELWKGTSEQEKKDTLIHEICHLVEMYVYGKVQRIKAGHGPIWDSYMRVCGLDPKSNRFHKLDCSNFQRKQHRWNATCPCGNIKSTTTTKARRIMAGTQNYICRRCRNRITITEQ